MGQNYGYETLMTELPTYMKQVLRFSLKEVSCHDDKKDSFLRLGTKFSLTPTLIFVEWYTVCPAIPGHVDLFHCHLIHCRLDDLFE